MSTRHCLVAGVVGLVCVLIEPLPAEAAAPSCDGAEISLTPDYQFLLGSARFLSGGEAESGSSFRWLTNGATQTHYLTDGSGRQYICSHFAKKYDPNSTNAQGLTYSGKIRFYDARSTPYNINTSYSTNNMKAVWVELTWDTGKLHRTRSLTTLVTRNGLQNYVYGN